MGTVSVRPSSASFPAEAWACCSVPRMTRSSWLIITTPSELQHVGRQEANQVTDACGIQAGAHACQGATARTLQ